MATFNISERLRRFVQIAIPTACIADQVRSLFIVHQLALERLQEWKDEENQKLVSDTALVLQQVVRRCQAKDADFWPPAVSAMAGVVLLEPSTNNNDTKSQTQGLGIDDEEVVESPLAHLPVFNDIFAASTTSPLTSSQGSAQTPSSHSSTSNIGYETAIHPPQAGIPSHDINTHQNQQQQHSGAAHPSASERAGALLDSAVKAAQQGVQRQMVVYVTLEDVWNHVVQTLHFLSPVQSAQSSSSSSSALQFESDGGVSVKNEFGTELEKKVIAAADSFKVQCKKMLPWPEATVVRKSALRYSMDWKGLQWPVPHRQPLERVLED